MQQKQDVIAIYSRKSRFTGKGESIGNQVDLCLSYIAATFGSSYAQNAVIFEDEGFSGGNLQRPDFQKMMKAAHQRQFKAIVVYRLDRISRNIGDFSHLIEELGKLHIDFISIREQFDTSSPMGRAMMYIASVFASWNGKPLPNAFAIICMSLPKPVDGLAVQHQPVTPPRIHKAYPLMENAKVPVISN